jgi:hypothetical protein
VGYDSKAFRVWATVSRHNSERDAAHDALWAEVRARVREIVAEPRYGQILLMADGLDDDE